MKTQHSQSRRSTGVSRRSTRTTWNAALTAGLALVLLVGCIPMAIQPFYTDEDLIQDVRILGEWRDYDGDVTWEFSGTEEQSYRLKVTEDGSSGLYEVRFFKLGDQTLLDMTQDKGAWEAAVKTNSALGLALPTHLVARVRWAGDQPKIGWLSADWLQEQLKERPNLLSHQQPEDGPLVLTGSTRELQAFLRKNATNDSAWEDDTVLSRPTESSPQ